MPRVARPAGWGGGRWGAEACAAVPALDQWGERVVEGGQVGISLGQGGEARLVGAGG